MLFKLIFVCCAVFVAGSARADITPGEMLSILNARDAQYADCVVDYQRIQMNTLEIPEMLIEQKDPALANPKLKDFVGKEVSMVFHERMIARGATGPFPNVWCGGGTDACDDPYCGDEGEGGNNSAGGSGHEMVACLTNSCEVDPTFQAVLIYGTISSTCAD